MRSLLLCSFLFACFVSVSQTSLNLRINIKLDTLTIPKYKATEVPDPEFKKIYVDVDYGGYTITNPKKLDLLKNSIVKSVELVYTKYPKDDDFSELNAKRLQFLHMLCPDVFSNPITQWSLISQTKCNSESSAKELFHGFVIIYKPGPTKESAAREMAHMLDVWKNNAPLPDSSVYKVFKRNKWQNMTVATDLTGSMSPYFSQVLLWYKLTFASKDFSEFIFFNDGDEKDDSKKIPGKTGGVYYCKGANKDSVLKLASTCMTNGYGGDIPENNIEAILFAVKQNPKLKEVIMIADNWAPMRDYNLTSQVKIPVHIIICGLSPGTPINSEYLDLARRTGGSIHTMEEDIQNLKELSDGKKVDIGEFEYKLVGGRFVSIRK